VSGALPLVVIDYLSGINSAKKSNAFLALDDQGCIKNVGGDVAEFDLSAVSIGQDALQQCAHLEGLLTRDSEPLIIRNTQLKPGQWVNLHLFYAKECRWVVYVDNTETAERMQTEQQQRLDEDLFLEQQKRAG
jgi:hypothetical protein